MKENKLADLSMDFSVQIINLVKDLKAKHEYAFNSLRCEGSESGKLMVLTTEYNSYQK